MNNLSLVNEISVSIKSTLKEALLTINNGGQGFCFVVENHQKFKGILTDGDIRRAFLSGANKDSLTKDFIKKQYVTLPITASSEEIQKTLSSKIRNVPLLDLNGIIKDYVSKGYNNLIPLAQPSLSGNEFKYVSECLETNWISSKGKFVDKFEESFSNFINMPYALAVSNGTVALSLALEALGIGEGDEVIVPDLTFAASINSIIHVGATPVIVDVNIETWTLDISLTKESITNKTKAIMPVHLYGHPANMYQIQKIAEEYNLLIIEDCAEALGSKSNNQILGSFGDASCFSFFGNKTITTGEGGMVLFKNSRVAKKARMLRDHGMSPSKRYWHEIVGYNYRMTNIQAAIGLAQLERVESFIKNKRDLAKAYSKRFRNINHIIQPYEAPWAYNTYWLYTVLISPEFGISRDEIIRFMSFNEIETRPVFFPLHEMPIYKKYTKGNFFPNSKLISEQGLCLPSAYNTSNEDIEKVVNIFKTMLLKKT